MYKGLGIRKRICGPFPTASISPGKAGQVSTVPLTLNLVPEPSQSRPTRIQEHSSAAGKREKREGALRGTFSCQLFPDTGVTVTPGGIRSLILERIGPSEVDLVSDIDMSLSLLCICCVTLTSVTLLTSWSLSFHVCKMGMSDNIYPSGLAANEMV